MQVSAQLPVTWSRLHADRSLGPGFSTTTVQASADGLSMVVRFDNLGKAVEQQIVQWMRTSTCARTA